MMRTHKLLFALFSLALILSACSKSASENELGETKIKETEPIFVQPIEDCNNSEEENQLLEYKQSINRGDKVQLSLIRQSFSSIAVREDLPNPYVKIALADGKSGFVFYDNRQNVTDIFVFGGFLSKEDFANVKPGETSAYDVVLMDPNTIGAPFSAASITGHISQEGVYIIKCASSGFGGVVDSIEFISNEEMNKKPLVKDGMTIPYILPEDRGT